MNNIIRNLKQTISFNLIDPTENDWTTDSDLLHDLIREAFAERNFKQEEAGSRISYVGPAPFIGDMYEAVQAMLDVAANHDGTSVIYSIRIDFNPYTEVWKVFGEDTSNLDTD